MELSISKKRRRQTTVHEPKSGPRPVFANKVLLENSHGRVLTDCLCVCAHAHGCTRTHRHKLHQSCVFISRLFGPQNLKYLLSLNRKVGQPVLKKRKRKKHTNTNCTEVAQSDSN